MNLDLAFILKSHKKNNKIILLGKNRGRFEIYVPLNLLIYNGLLVRCELEKRTVVERFPSDFKFQKDQLTFYHLVLEVCEKFIPAGLECSDIFDLIYFLYFSFENFSSCLAQKVFLCKLISQLGLGPDGSKFVQLFELMLNPIDIIAKQTIDLKTEELLNSFIKESLYLNPEIYGFNAKNFFSEVGII